MVIMSNWQEWGVALILLVCAGRIVFTLFSFFRKNEKKSNPCQSCISACSLRPSYKEKRVSCGVVNKKIK